MSERKRSYRVLRCRLPAASEEVLLNTVVARSGDGFAGSETRQSGAELEVLVYLDASAWLPSVGGGILETIAALPGIEVLGHELVPERDWLAEYRELAQPVRIGRFVFDPREPDARADRRVMPAASISDDQEAVRAAAVEAPWRLRIPARQAFGTGSHASTALLVELLERNERVVRDARVLDVGTGSGILSFVSLLLGARSVVGLDVDAQAVFVAAHNRALNHLEPSFMVGSARSIRGAPRFDLIVANVIPEQLSGEEPHLARLLAPTGMLMLSGVLSERFESVASSWRALGLEIAESRSDGEWTALAMARAAPPFLTTASAAVGA